VEKVLHPLNRLLKVKTLATREKRAQATAATMAMMVTKLPGTKRILRRLTSRSRRFPKYSPLVVVPVYLYILLVVVLCLNNLFFCKLLTCAGPASWACAGRDACANSSR
jgi:hypothetical protein